MDNNVSISNSHESELQFDVSVEGTDVSNMRVRFVIKTDKADYSFDCKQGDEAAKWVVKIPAMSHLKAGTYDFKIEVITNGYYFDPYEGEVAVTPKPTVKTSTAGKPPTPKVKVSQPAETTKEKEKVEKKPKKEPEKETKKEKVEEKTTELVDAFLKSKENKLPLSEKEKAVKEALKDFKAKPLSPRLPKRDVKKRPAPKKRVIETDSDEPRRSNLSNVIEKMGIPKDEQARKVQEIINSTKDMSDED